MITVLFFGLARLALINDERRAAEKQRGDLLQKGIDTLRSRSEEDRQFYEIIRQLIIAQNEQDRQALVAQLRGFKFATATTTSPTTTKGSSTTSTTSATPKSSTTTAPPSTTTTTAPRTPTTTCVTTPVASVCR